MEQKKIDRLSELTQKEREGCLTEEEITERQELRQEYIKDLRANFEVTMENVMVLDKDGNEVPIQKKGHSNGCSCGCHHDH